MDGKSQEGRQAQGHGQRLAAQALTRGDASYKGNPNVVYRMPERAGGSKAEAMAALSDSVDAALAAFPCAVGGEPASARALFRMELSYAEDAALCRLAVDKAFVRERLSELPLAKLWELGSPKRSWVREERPGWFEMAVLRAAAALGWVAGAEGKMRQAALGMAIDAEARVAVGSLWAFGNAMADAAQEALGPAAGLEPPSLPTLIWRQARAAPLPNAASEPKPPAA